MWTISEHQLIAISNSMRDAFEQRACFTMIKEYNNFQESEIRKIIHKQTDKLVFYNINKEEIMMQFIRLSLEHPVLSAEMLPEDIHGVLSSEFEGNIKMKKMIDLLNNNDYGI